MKWMAAAYIALALSGCMSTRVVLEPKADSRQKVSYEDHFDYYFLGLAGHPTVSLQKVCMEQKIYSFKFFRNPEDVLITWLTFGIYSPATLRVWCGD